MPAAFAPKARTGNPAVMTPRLPPEHPPEVPPVTPPPAEPDVPIEEPPAPGPREEPPSRPPELPPDEPPEVPPGQPEDPAEQPETPSVHSPGLQARRFSLSVLGSAVAPRHFAGIHDRSPEASLPASLGG